ncbi:MAG: sulfatase [Octadecabacter sp.]
MSVSNINTRIWSIASLILAAGVFHLVLIQPNHPGAMTWGAVTLFPLELPAVLLGLLALGTGRMAHGARATLTLVLTLTVVWKAADAAMFTALSRGFNPLTDMSLVVAFLNLMSGTFGWGVAVLAVLASILAVVVVAFLLWWASGVWARAGIPRALRNLAAVGALCSLGVVVAQVGHTMGRWVLPVEPPGIAFTARLGIERVGLVWETLTNMRNFRNAVATDRFANQDGLFDLIDRDVFVIFVESYGRTSFDTPQYAQKHLETLRTAQADLRNRGLTMASTFLRSPTRGGQSWLAHSTFANGLWISDQSRYGAALKSGRQTVYHIAQNAGFQTAAVMPQITLAWPESDTMGFDTILAADDLGYEGRPFNWITMPDQFTFTAMDRLLDTSQTGDTPLFVQIALGSSHAPWVPVPELIAWADVGNGTIYDPVVAASDTPDVVWQDYDRVRTQYGLAVDYALQTVFSYVALHSETAPLFFIIGDHQAAGFVALDDRPDVPIHVVGPKHLVELIVDDNFHAGLIPPANTNVSSMMDMRELLIQTFSSDVSVGPDQ